MDKCFKELSKSASRALGALHGKFICAGGMTNAVYTKLYTTMPSWLNLSYFTAPVYGELNNTLL